MLAFRKTFKNSYDVCYGRRGWSMDCKVFWCGWMNKARELRFDSLSRVIAYMLDRFWILITLPFPQLRQKLRDSWFSSVLRSRLCRSYIFFIFAKDHLAIKHVLPQPLIQMSALRMHSSIMKRRIFQTAKKMINCSNWVSSATDCDKSSSS